MVCQKQITIFYCIIALYGGPIAICLYNLLWPKKKKSLIFSSRDRAWAVGESHGATKRKGHYWSFYKVHGPSHTSNPSTLNLTGFKRMLYFETVICIETRIVFSVFSIYSSTGLAFTLSLLHIYIKCTWKSETHLKPIKTPLWSYVLCKCYISSKPVL